MSKPNINLNYKEQGGMLLPDLQISNSSEADRPLGRYGRMALEYLKDNQPERYTILKMDGSLMEVMHRVQDEAMEKIEALTQQMLQQEPMPQTEDIGLDVGSYVKDLMRYCPENVVDQVMEHQDALLRRLGTDYLSVIAFMPYEEDGGVRYA